MNTVDEYIAVQSYKHQAKLETMRQAIKKTIPDALESMAYGMPAYKLKGKPLAYFGAAKNHIGFYGTPVTHEAFAEELSRYKQGKGSVQFPLDEELPIALIIKMIRYKAKAINGSEKIK